MQQKPMMHLWTVYKGKNTRKGQSEAYESVLSGEGASRRISVVLVQGGGEGEEYIAAKPQCFVIKVQTILGVSRM